MTDLTPDEAAGLRRLIDLKVIDAPDTSLGAKTYAGLVARGLATIIASRPGYIRVRLAEVAA